MVLPAAYTGGMDKELEGQFLGHSVKTLEQHGLVELVEERRKGNMTERVVRASAAAYVISPAALAVSMASPRAASLSAKRPAVLPRTGPAARDDGARGRAIPRGRRLSAPAQAAR